MNLYNTFSFYIFKCALQEVEWVRSDLSMYKMQKTSAIFAQNWIFYCSFPYKRLMLLSRQIDF